jgi:hypothetical protein
MTPENDTAIATIQNNTGAITTPGQTPDWLAEMSTNRDFFPRLQLNGGSSDVVKTGKSAINIYCIVAGTEITDLDKTVDCKVIAARPKALDMSVSGTVKSYYDHKSEAFRNVVARANNTPPGQMSGFLFGPEFLVWVPKIEKFVTFMLSSTSAKGITQKMMELIGSWVTLSYDVTSKEVRGKKQTWNFPLVKKSSIVGAEPDPAEALSAEKKFKEELSSAVVPTAQPAATEGAGS